MTPDVTLRYFDCRGRVQALRYLLVDQDIPFTDERVPFNETWPARKPDPSFSGPFGALPVLHWGSLQFAQTEAIALFLAQTLDLAGDGSPVALSRTIALCCFGHQDLLHLALGVIWQPPDVSAEALATAMEGARARVKPRLARLETMLSGDDGYLLGSRPCAGDYFVFEAIEVAKLVLGPSLLDEVPRVQAFCARVAQRPRLAAYIASGERPDRLSGSPAEAHVRAMLRQQHA